MWHGASWNFIIWGVYFGLIVMIEKYTLLRVQDKIPSVLLHIYSMLLVIAGWGIFYFDDFNQMVTFFHAFFGQVDTVFDFVDESALLNNFWLWVVAVLFCMPLRSMIENHGNSVFLTIYRIVVSVVILVLSTALLVGATNNAFIYTRF
jgi:alginate O-acetyltransferase complex protein AlgI